MHNKALQSDQVKLSRRLHWQAARLFHLAPEQRRYVYFVAKELPEGMSANNIKSIKCLRCSLSSTLYLDG